MPAWIRDYCGASPAFEFTQGRDFPSDLDRFDAVSALRRLYAERQGNGMAPEGGFAKRRAYGELRRRYRVYARYPGTCARAVGVS